MYFNSIKTFKALENVYKYFNSIELNGFESVLKLIKYQALIFANISKLLIY